MERKNFKFHSHHSARGTSIIDIFENDKKDFLISKTLKTDKVHLYWSDKTEDGMEMLENEIKFLSILDKYDQFPSMIDYDLEKKVIWMSFVGDNIAHREKVLIPENWKEQLIVLYEILKENDIYHNDIFEGNICVKNNQLKLIDFGQTTHCNPHYPWFNLSLKTINESNTIYEMCEKILDYGMGVIACLYVHNKRDKRVN